MKIKSLAIENSCMWHQRSSREDLENVILKRVNERLGPSYYSPTIEELAKRLAHQFVYSLPSQRIKKSYIESVNDGVNYIIGYIWKK